MPKKTPLTEKEKELIIKLYTKGNGAPYIANVIGVTTSKISYFIKKQGIGRTCSEAARKYHYDEDFFHEINTSEKAYWLGFIYADGYVSNKKDGKRVCIALSSKDKEHLIKFQKCINGDVPVHDYVSKTGYGENTKYSRITLCGNKIYDDAVKQGVLEHKTNIITPPNISEEFYSHFIRGYFDGDGCISQYLKKHHVNRPGKHQEFSIKILGTKELLDFIKEFIESNDVAKINRYHQRREGQTVLALEFSGNYQVKKFLDLIYTDATVYLDRKYERYQNLCNLLNSRVTSEDVA